MKVIALETGFHNGQRFRQGQTFDVPDGSAADWFAPLGCESPAAAKAPAPTPATLSEMGKQPNKSFLEQFGPSK